MTVESYLQRSLWNLESTLKHTVLSHRSDLSNVWVNVNQLLTNRSILSVYCDCSVGGGKFNLGVCIVGLGTCHLYGTTRDTKHPQHTVLGEIHAVRYAIQCSQDFLNTVGNGVELHSIRIFTDVDHIEGLLHVNTARLNKPIRRAVQRLRRSMKRFGTEYTHAKLNVSYLEKTPVTRNLHYKCAHKTAKKVAGILTHF